MEEVMDQSKRKVLEAAEEKVEIVQRATKSQQPRFTTDAESFFSSVYRWVTETDLEIPTYNTDSRIRDAWLREFWMKETHLAGVLNSSVLIDANRGFNLIGGRNQVNRYMEISHMLEAGKGWRAFHRRQSLAFRTADMGAVHEIGRDGKNGPMRTLWSVDPARCRNTGEIKTPIGYFPPNGGEQHWRDKDFFKTVSMPSTDEKFKGLGFCMVSRAYEIAKTMIAVYRHDHEALGARAPKGLLLLQNIEESQWEKAMETREVRMDSEEWVYYGAMAVLAGGGADPIDAKMVSLSQLPKGFDRQQFTDLLMFAYALVAGFPPEEFWVVRGGALGRGQEAEIQQRMATAKGVMDYPATFQEDYQKLLPKTLQFEFEERDVEGEMRDAEVEQAKAALITSVYESAPAMGESLISRDEARYLLAEQGLIPSEWTEAEEDVSVDDTDVAESRSKRQELLDVYRERPRVQRAAEHYFNDPIVRYSWPDNRIITLWERGDDMFRPRLWRARKIERQDDSEVLFEEGDVKITEEDVTRSIAQGTRRVGAEFGELLDNEPIE